MADPRDGYNGDQNHDEGGWGGAGGDRGESRRSASPRQQRDRSRSPPPRQSGGDDRGRGQQQRGQGESTNPGNNLHVSSLSFKVEEADLEAIFGKFGRIQKCQVMRDPHTKESRGFAFVTMEEPNDADAAIDALNATELLGKSIVVQKAKRARARTPTPGQYYGPPKGDDRGPPRGYGGGYGRDDRYGGRRDDYRDDYRPRDRYDDRRDRGSYGGPPPPRREDYYDRDSGRYDDRRGGGRDRYEDRRY